MWVSLKAGSATEKAPCITPTAASTWATSNSAKRTGQGTMNYPDGRQYTGEFKEGKPTGSGTMIYPDGKKVDRGI